MATVINNPAVDTRTSEGSGVGTVVAIVIALIVIAALLFAGIPLLRGQGRAPNSTNGATVNVPSSLDVNVPDKVNVDVNKQ